MEMKKTWNSRLSVGSTVIDNQHKVLFDLIKDLSNAIRAGKNIRILDTLMTVLLNYAFQHFETEESYFKNHQDYAKHCLEHYRLIKKLNQFIVDFRNNRPIEEKVPSEFLENWLIEHIEEFDRPFLNDATVDIRLMKESDKIDEFEPEQKERRQARRIRSGKVVDGDIRVSCYNATRLKSSNATIVDMSTGGLMLKSTGHHQVDDLLIVSCNIGSNFRMKEKVKVKTAKDDTYGVEFISPSPKTTDFFTRLYGSIHFNRHSN